MNDLLIKFLVIFVAMVITSITFIGTFELMSYVLNKINN